MTGRTHDLAAFTAVNLILTTQALPPISLSTALVSLGACFIGGLAPDIDTATSSFWQKIPAGTFMGRILHPLFRGHRLISHSILGLIIFGLIMKWLLGLASATLLVNMDIVWWAFMIGLISHLIMDSLTQEGVPWLFPIPIRFGFPPLRAFRINTGGLLEKILIFPSLLILNGYLFYSFYQTYINFFRQFIW